jgi:hypothetical protein
VRTVVLRRAKSVHGDPSVEVELDDDEFILTAHPHSEPNGDLWWDVVIVKDEGLS